MSNAIFTDSSCLLIKWQKTKKKHVDINQVNIGHHWTQFWTCTVFLIVQADFSYFYIFDHLSLDTIVQKFWLF